MDFSAFDTRKMEEYAAQAKAQWGETAAWQEYEQKSKGQQPGQQADTARDIMGFFVRFGALRGTDPAGEPAQETVKTLQDYISEHMYTCTKEILSGLGKMYDAGGAFTQNIDAAGGEGTAHFAALAIEAYCK